jgi:hypothetical protein
VSAHARVSAVAAALAVDDAIDGGPRGSTSSTDFYYYVNFV